MSPVKRSEKTSASRAMSFIRNQRAAARLLVQRLDERRRRRALLVQRLEHLGRRRSQFLEPLVPRAAGLGRSPQIPPVRERVAGSERESDNNDNQGDCVFHGDMGANSKRAVNCARKLFENAIEPPRRQGAEKEAPGRRELVLGMRGFALFSLRVKSLDKKPPPSLHAPRLRASAVYFDLGI